MFCKTFPQKVLLRPAGPRRGEWLLRCVQALLAFRERYSREWLIAALAGLCLLAYPIAGTVLAVLVLFWVLVIGATTSASEHV